MSKNKLWFKAKRYGWGWYPASWEGWLVTILYILFILYRSNKVSAMFDTESSFVFRYTFEIIFMTIPLILICYLKGEKPKWHWGEKKSK